MIRARFQDLLDSHGSDLSGWPDTDRGAAERLVASDAEAAAALAEARRLDGLIRAGLAASPSETESEVIATRLLAALPDPLPAQMPPSAGAYAIRPAAARRRDEPESQARNRLFSRPVLPGAAALSLAAACGIALGIFWAQKITQDEQTTDTIAAIFQSETAIGTF
ncbi:hypothetical protein [Rhodomicrobium lacus]|uniref:hypothetical protein n=1 Tax=Rhodomicrobium lacus TaxID=2498452 RepID=UPI0026E2DE9D|nr:hypothetical protein [Rhodomicrobium lacus]WKW50236.1 hypothetical protein QMO75_13230 [Rhodomicrobium lacus]